jgi:hypothetical protein
MAQDAVPRVLIPGFRLQQVAAAPTIVTPIALTFDDRGQLLVIESHTHQRPDDYEGPAHDRILRLIDDDQDGCTDRVVTFLEGTDQTMSVARGPSGWVYVATRGEIMRVRDTDDDGRADQREAVVQMLTSAVYPHNGLAGLTFAPDGRLIFGLGENEGLSYRLQGSDGRTLAGEGEGGSVYACRADGSQLQRLATGFWNPFGSCFDPQGRLFTVDNDPDASPPCRLLHVVRAGDYGYQYRFGRSGRHPLQAWDAELPGTLPMAVGTGEAPCQVVPYRGRLWVTSWGDYRIETYALRSEGASCQAQPEVVVQGDARFRPVGLAIAPDGSLYFSDWVDRDYPVHRQGRVWRLIPPTEPTQDAEFPQLSPAELRAAALRDSSDRQQLLDGLLDDDPFVRQAASAGLANSSSLDTIELAQLPSARQRLGVLQALRWRDPDASAGQLEAALSDPDPDVCIYALRMIGEQRRVVLRPAVVRLLDERQPLEARLGAVALATLAWLDEGQESQDLGTLQATLVAYLNNPRSAPALRRLALRWLPKEHEALSVARLRDVIDHDAQLAPDAIAILADKGDPAAGAALARVAHAMGFESSIRADACAALAAYLPDQQAVIESLRADTDANVRREAERNLRPRVLTNGVPSGSARQVPAELADDRLGPGDPEAGRRVFFRAVGGRCSVCHTYDGRGGQVGPELTTIRKRGNRQWLIETILDPNRDVAPRFAAVTVFTTDGRTFTGQAMPGPGDDAAETFMQADGLAVTIPLAEIDSRHYQNRSIMPEGLGQVLAPDELRDLVAFLAP